MHQFTDDPFPFSSIVTPNGGRHTPMQMAVENQPADMI
jgi:hypothetical protein